MVFMIEIDYCVRINLLNRNACGVRKVRMKIINYQINSLRKNLYILISIHKLTDEPVIKCSQKLDELINKYQKDCFLHI